MFQRILIATVVATMVLGGSARAADSPEVMQLFQRYEQQRGAKQYKEAIETLDLILILAPGHADAWTEGAWIFNEQGKFPQAAEAAAMAIKTNPNHSRAWAERGYALLKDKKYKEATVALLAAVEKGPKNWTAYDYLAEALDKQGETKLANDVRALKAAEKAKGLSTVKRD